MTTNDLPPRSWPMQALQALATMPATRAELATMLDTSASTIDRAIWKLHDGGLIEEYAIIRSRAPSRPPAYWDTTDRVKRGEA